MSANSQTTAERKAIREIIRAKSDREVARLLCQSYRLLNLHRRRRSTVSHRERWTDYELRLLGRIRDEELAKLLRRGVTAVAGKRESLGIGIFAPQRIRWSKRENELLGERPDGVVARMLGRTRYAVQLKRHSLGSAADSLVCYCLGISDVCPIRFGLYFRRFLNKERLSTNFPTSTLISPTTVKTTW